MQVISVDWCRWAGIRRVFYWDAVENAFKCVKTNDLLEIHYQTQAERRLSEREASLQNS